MSRLSPSNRWRPIVVLWALAAGGFVAVAVPAYRSGNTLGHPAIVTGYSLFAIMVFLLLFNARKRLPMLPLGRAHWWTLAHSVAGILAAALFFLHAETVWPNSTYERAMTLLFYVATLSGIFGYVIQRLYPKRLTGTRLEVIYERIPLELAELREKAESVVLRCTKEARSETLARYYVETFEWFFRQPRFLISHLTGAHKSDYWIEHRIANSRHYLNEFEAEFLDELHALAEEKDKIDFHFAAQRLMKGWLLVHVPSVVGLIVLVLWHLLIVNIYGL
jgi:hypothetical protein